MPPPEPISDGLCDRFLPIGQSNQRADPERLLVVKIKVIPVLFNIFAPLVGLTLAAPAINKFESVVSTVCFGKDDH